MQHKRRVSKNLDLQIITIRGGLVLDRDSGGDVVSTASVIFFRGCVKISVRLKRGNLVIGQIKAGRLHDGPKKTVV